MRMLIVLLQLALPCQVPGQPDVDSTHNSFTSIPPDACSPEDAGPVDSLSRIVALLDCEKAELDVSATGLWHRILPQVQAGATLGVREIVFPATAGALALPKDSYRLTLSLSLTDVFDGSKHRLAELALERKKAEYALLLQNQMLAQRADHETRLTLTRELSLLKEEMRITESLAEYNELLFSQGKALFPAVARARLDLVRMRREIVLLENQLREQKGVVAPRLPP